MQASIPSASAKPSWDHAARWLALIGGVINPIAFVSIVARECITTVGHRVPLMAGQAVPPLSSSAKLYFLVT